MARRVTPPKESQPAQDATELFRRNIRRFREEMELNRDDAAARIGISSKYLYLLERGERAVPKFDVMKRIAKAYGRRVDDLDHPDPPAADLDMIPVLTYHLSLTPEQRKFVAREVRDLMLDLDRHDQRIRERLRELRRT